MLPISVYVKQMTELENDIRNLQEGACASDALACKTLTSVHVHGVADKDEAFLLQLADLEHVRGTFIRNAQYLRQFHFERAELICQEEMRMAEHEQQV